MKSQSIQNQDYLMPLFQKLSQKLNRPFGQMKPFYLILKQNWYDNQTALKQLKEQQFLDMKIPARLAKAIIQEVNRKEEKNREKANQIGGQKKQELGQKQKMNLQKNYQNNNTSNNNNIVLTQFTMTQYTNQLQNHLRKQYNNDINVLIQIFQTLYKIIHNIIADPYELKFRTLKKSNSMIQRIIIKNISVSKYLYLFGFVQDQQKYSLKEVKTHQLIFIEEVINYKVQQFKKQTFRQQPFMGNNIKMSEKPLRQPQMLEKQLMINKLGSFQQQFNTQKLNQMKYVDALDKLVQFRHKIMSQPPSDRKLQIYHKKYQTKNLQKFTEVNMQQELQKSDNKQIQSYWSQIINQNRKNTNFQSKRKQQFQFLVKQKIHKQTIIKVKLPNQFIIEASFGPLQKLSNVFHVVSDIIIGDIYLFHAPPVKRYDKQMDKTLSELDSVPMGSFYLGINGDWYIQNKYASMVKK